MTARVTPIAWTTIAPPDVLAAATNDQWTPAEPPAGDGETLAEFAGRACYQSWSRPNPATATNAGYLRHILESGHYSVLEHATVTFYLTGVSRSFTHELVRHRHFSYSQLSQRYVSEQYAQAIVPDVIADDPDLNTAFLDAWYATQVGYQKLVEGLRRKLSPRCPACTGVLVYERDPAGWWCPVCITRVPGPDLTGIRKAARQAARSVLPNATETRIVVTGNYRAWRHFVAKRATEHADVEIRDVAIAILRHLQRLAPNVFGDFEITELGDGTLVAHSLHTDDG